MEHFFFQVTIQYADAHGSQTTPERWAFLSDVQKDLDELRELWKRSPKVTAGRITYGEKTQIVAYFDNPIGISKDEFQFIKGPVTVSDDEANEEFTGDLIYTKMNQKPKFEIRTKDSYTVSVPLNYRMRIDPPEFIDTKSSTIIELQYTETAKLHETLKSTKLSGSTKLKELTVEGVNVPYTEDVEANALYVPALLRGVTWKQRGKIEVMEARYLYDVVLRKDSQQLISSSTDVETVHKFTVYAQTKPRKRSRLSKLLRKTNDERKTTDEDTLKSQSQTMLLRSSTDEDTPTSGSDVSVEAGDLHMQDERVSKVASSILQKDMEFIYDGEECDEHKTGSAGFISFLKTVLSVECGVEKRKFAASIKVRFIATKADHSHIGSEDSHEGNGLSLTVDEDDQSHMKIKDPEYKIDGPHTFSFQSTMTTDDAERKTSMTKPRTPTTKLEFNYVNYVSLKTLKRYLEVLDTTKQVFCSTQVEETVHSYTFKIEVGGATVNTWFYCRGDTKEIVLGDVHVVDDFENDLIECERLTWRDGSLKCNGQSNEKPLIAVRITESHGGYPKKSIADELQEIEIGFNLVEQFFKESKLNEVTKQRALLKIDGKVAMIVDKLTKPDWKLRGSFHTIKKTATHHIIDVSNDKLEYKDEKLNNGDINKEKTFVKVEPVPTKILESDFVFKEFLTLRLLRTYLQEVSSLGQIRCAGTDPTQFFFKMVYEGKVLDGYYNCEKRFVYLNDHYTLLKFSQKRVIERLSLRTMTESPENGVTIDYRLDETKILSGIFYLDENFFMTRIGSLKDGYAVRLRNPFTVKSTEIFGAPIILDDQVKVFFRYVATTKE